ncbi:MAG: pitrilysin family protein [Acidobacteriota bacterium]
MSARPPLPTASRNVVFPSIPEARLPGGHQLICVDDDQLPRVSVTIGLPAGRAHEPEKPRGLLQLSIQMLKEGTSARSSRQTAEQLDRLAADLDTDVYMEHSSITLTCLKEHLAAALEVLSDLVLNPIFPEQELDKLLTRWRSLLVAQRADPGFLANERLFLGLFPDHPYSRISVPPGDLDLIDRGALQDFYSRHSHLAGTLIVFAGAISIGRAEELVHRSFPQLSGSPAPHFDPPETEARGIQVLLVNRPGSAQTKVLVGMRGLKRAHPEYHLLKLVNQVLGGGGSARLFLRLREQKGYTYGAYSSVSGYAQAGVLVAGTSVRTEKTREAVTDILEEMTGLREAPPAQAELDRCKAELIGAFLRRLETPASVAALEATRRLTGLPLDYYREFIPRIQSVTTRQVQEAAARFLLPEHSLVVVIGDRRVLEPELASLGPVSVFNAAGQPLGAV